MKAAKLNFPVEAQAVSPVLSPWRFGYHPQLDGTRAFAILAVLGGHAAPGAFPAGYIGVDLFFSLSGFLITSILLEEWLTHGKIQLFNFYTRRFLRLGPALVAMLAVLVPLGFFVPGREPLIKPQAAVFAMLYLSNWAASSWGLDLGTLTHTWSLAVEEQFYLFWPLALIGILKTSRNLSRAMLLTAIFAMTGWGARLLLEHSGAAANRLQYGLDCRADALLWGAVAALGNAAGVFENHFLKRVISFLGPVAASSMVVSIFLKISWDDVWMQRLGYSVNSIAGAVSIIWLLSSSKMSLLSCHLLKSSIFRKFGRNSYGMYLWHFPIMYGVERLMPGASGHFWIPVFLVVTYVASELSYQFIERPIQGLKSRFRAFG